MSLTAGFPAHGCFKAAYDYADTEEQAERRRADLIDQITKGRVPQARATVNDLIDRWLSVADLELITTVNYQSYIERVIRPVLGGLQLREFQDRVEVLDELSWWRRSFVRQEES